MASTDDTLNIFIAAFFAGLLSGLLITWVRDQYRLRWRFWLRTRRLIRCDACRKHVQWRNSFYARHTSGILVHMCQSCYDSYYEPSKASSPTLPKGEPGEG